MQLLLYSFYDKRLIRPRARRTFDGVAAGVDAEGDAYEKGEDLFGGARRPLHQTRQVEQRVENEEERRPETDARVKCEKVQVKVLADAEND